MEDTIQVSVHTRLCPVGIWRFNWSSKHNSWLWEQSCTERKVF